MKLKLDSTLMAYATLTHTGNRYNESENRKFTDSNTVHIKSAQVESNVQMHAVK